MNSRSETLKSQRREDGKVKHTLGFFLCVFYECVSPFCLHVKSSLIRSCGGSEPIGTFHLNLSRHTQGWRDLIYGCTQVGSFLCVAHLHRLHSQTGGSRGGGGGLDVICYRLQITCCSDHLWYTWTMGTRSALDSFIHSISLTKLSENYPTNYWLCFAPSQFYDVFPVV